MGRSLNEHFFTFSLFTFRSREIVSKNEASSMMAIAFFYQPLVMLRYLTMEMAGGKGAGCGMIPSGLAR